MPTPPVTAIITTPLATVPSRRAARRVLALAIPLAATVAAALAPFGASPAHAQGNPLPTIDSSPYWIHVTPAIGATAVARPGNAGGPVAALQLEVSRSLPIGFGMGGGYWFPTGNDTAAPDGPFAEALLVYRFRLRARGIFSPYAGPIVGAIRDDTGDERELRGFFGGRGGVDIPVRTGWPAIRLEASYRHVSDAAALGGTDTVVFAVGGRWSLPLATD